MRAVILCCQTWTIPHLWGQWSKSMVTRENLVEKNLLQCHLIHNKLSYEVSQLWNQCSEVIKQHPTTWIMVRPKITFIFSTRECIHIDNHEFHLQKLITSVYEFTMNLLQRYIVISSDPPCNDLITYLPVKQQILLSTKISSYA